MKPEFLSNEECVVMCDKHVHKLNTIKIWQKDKVVLSGEEFTVELSNIILKIKDGLIHIENKN